MINAQYGKIKYIDEIMAVYRRHGESVFRSMSDLDILEFNANQFIFLYNFFQDHEIKKILKNEAVVRYNKLINIYFNKGDINNFVKVLIKIFIVRPNEVLYRLNGKYLNDENRKKFIKGIIRKFKNMSIPIYKKLINIF